jgi:hypothetical protein
LHLISYRYNVIYVERKDGWENCCVACVAYSLDMSGLFAILALGRGEC